MEPPDKNCFTLPDGSCKGNNCMHDEKPESLSYPETLELMLQDGVNILSSVVKDKNYYITVSREIIIEDYLKLCKELGFEPTS